MKKWIYNPFVYIAGARALAIGMVIMIVAAVILPFNNGHFDGAVDVHFGAKTTLIRAFCETLISWACLVLALYGFGLITSESSVRFIDIAGTTALARAPMIFLALLGFIASPPDIDPHKATLQELMKIALSPGVITEAILSLPILVWTIALMHNAFSVSTNLKGGKSVAAFIGGLVVAELVSKIILHYLHNAF